MHNSALGICITALFSYHFMGRFFFKKETKVMAQFLSMVKKQKWLCNVSKETRKTHFPISVVSESMADFSRALTANKVLTMQLLILKLESNRAPENWLCRTNIRLAILLELSKLYTVYTMYLLYLF